MGFKEQIREDEELLAEYVEENVSRLIAYRAIPLIPSMMDRLGFLQNDFISYSVMNKRDLNRTAKLQNSKAHISTFTKGGYGLMQLPSQPDVLVMLEGTAVIEGNADIWTAVSTKGRRWIDITTRGGKEAQKLIFGVNGILQGIAKNMGLDKDIYKMSWNDLEEYIIQLPQKTQIDLYRKYLKGIEKYLNKNYKTLNSYLRAELRNMKYNEIVLTDFEILQVWSINNESEIVHNECKKLGLKYSGVIGQKDMAKIA